MGRGEGGTFMFVFVPGPMEDTLYEGSEVGTEWSEMRPCLIEWAIVWAEWGWGICPWEVVFSDDHKK
jgi:hypothetical protein